MLCPPITTIHTWCTSDKAVHQSSLPETQVSLHRMQCLPLVDVDVQVVHASADGHHLGNSSRAKGDDGDE